MHAQRIFPFIFLLLTVFLVSCGAEERYDNETQAPENVIPKEKFVSILTDLLLIDVYVGTNQLRTEPPFKIYRSYERGTFERHGVDTAQYFASFDYYYGNSKIAEFINIMLMDSVEKRREKFLGIEKDTTGRKNERNYR
jgi:hypothetical protein